MEAKRKNAKSPLVEDPPTKRKKFIQKRDGSKEDDDAEKIIAESPADEDDEDEEDDELIDAPVVEDKEPVDDFKVKIAEFDKEISAVEAEIKAAQEKFAELEKKLATARAALLRTKDKLNATLGSKGKYLCNKARELNTKIIREVNHPSIKLKTQKGEEVSEATPTVSYYGKFQVNDNWTRLGEYETPEQVEKVIGMLKGAVERGDSEFTFPTIEELEKPAPEMVKGEYAAPPDEEKLRASLIRAMKICLEKVQRYCREHNLPAAQNEMKLYQICNETTRELVEAVA